MDTHRVAKVESAAEAAASAVSAEGCYRDFLIQAAQDRAKPPATRPSAQCGGTERSPGSDRSSEQARGRHRPDRLRLAIARLRQDLQRHVTRRCGPLVRRSSA
ncbi:hypothetical protein SEA_MCKLOVIN_15 [Gordonia phage Mcklovin]|uniref:Uncharacterized protein n=1 Tax=Gordonia phage Mcklovin TaxID=2652881 RepID=A0A5P8DCY9_9CAUD|nr:hypothetical protein PP514_gp15 [Gordonia phage Mcklovin]QFP96864.1 hypothetical protein SEA_MCKLOVIN_15 [Gordonia phage Mcklovin]